MVGPVKAIRSWLYVQPLPSGNRRRSGGVAAGSPGPPGHPGRIPSTDALCRSRANHIVIRDH